MENFLKKLQRGMEPQAKRMREAIRAEIETWSKALNTRYEITIRKLPPENQKTKK